MKVKTIAGVLASVKGAAAALAFFGIVSTASAETVYVTYIGTVLSVSTRPASLERRTRP